ncbi:MAG: T9SS type A sorting domain-containing protein [Saprospirales bacterium]|nr:T9SS type A sorting domain-containing protein [Saprospirales bacterium]
MGLVEGLLRAKVSNYKLHGSIEVGGDVIVYNNTGDCDNGVYFRMTNYYEDNLLECDGRTASHPDNLDVNNSITPFTQDEMDLACNCDNYPGCLIVGVDERLPIVSDSDYLVFPNPASNSVTFRKKHPNKNNVNITLYNTLNNPVLTKTLNALDEIQLDVSRLAEGIYIALISEDGKIVESMKIILHR